MPRSLVLVATVFALHSPAEAQVGRIADQGSFTISMNGRTAGRENFRISAIGGGDITEYLARGEVTYGDRRVTPELLRTTPEGAVVEYKVTTRSGATTESWEGASARSRFGVRIVSARGTSVREHIIPAGAILLDDEVIHHHWFLVHRTRSGSIPVVVPRRSDVQARVSMTTVGDETLQIGNHGIPATHIRATVDGGEVHDIWVDKSGRLLKVALPGRNLVAVRDDPPPA
ncbi:MAG TPA: hypothetical protein VFZ73_01440 [Gemmatimonadaceae bacterium]